MEDLKFGNSIRFFVVTFGLILASKALAEEKRYNVLFVISDDLTTTALGCYGNKVCQTPHIDKLAGESVLFTKAYAQATSCGPSRASFMFGYYPMATGSTGYVSGRERLGDRYNSWPQYFRKHGWYAARVSKIYHMGVPPDIAKGNDGSDDPASWDEAHNSQGPEARAPGKGETLQNNPEERTHVAGGNKLVNVAADGDGMVHSDGKTAAKSEQLIGEFKAKNKPWFLAVGFVRPHVPFVAPKKYFDMYPYEKMELPPKGVGTPTPKSSLNARTSQNFKMNERQQKKAVSGYYASVSYLDAQVGRVMQALDKTGQRENTIVIFTSDHGFHLGEHDLWMKVSVHEESARVPLLISVPGMQPAVCHSIAELIDLYPSTASLCGLAVPENLQGVDVSPMLKNPNQRVKQEAICGSLMRTEKWALIRYGKKGFALYDMVKDPQQYHNLAGDPTYADVLADLIEQRAKRLAQIQDSGLDPATRRGKLKRHDKEKSE